MLLAVAALLATAPIVTLSEKEIDTRIGLAAQQPQLGTRIEMLSRLFVGVPYVDFPLGEGGTGPEPQPRWRTDGVDCQTFVETVLAMANAKNLSHAKGILDDLRYSGDRIAFATRNHFTEAQWLPANMEKGYLDDAAAAIDKKAPTAWLVLNRSQWSKVPALQRLVPADIPEGKFPLRYIPIREMKKRRASFANGSVILVVREHDARRVVQVSHMGFLLQSPSGLVVRHAATHEKRVIDEPFDHYVERNAEFKSWKVIGFGIARPLEAKARAAQIAGG